MKTPLVSIIVPVYKAEQWLHRCIDSILAQTMPDFELLLIDDGSPDRSGDICDEYATQDPRVRVFHKPNGGVSSARNLGLDHARGEWISFIDADDWVESDYLVGLTEHLDADFILGGVNIGGQQLSEVETKQYDKNQIKYFIEKYLLNVVLLSPWGNLLKLKLIEDLNLRFDEKVRYAEDRIFNREYLLSCESIRSMSASKYNYFIDEDVICYADKFNLSIKEIDYLSCRIYELNEKLIDTFSCELDKNELKNSILNMFLSEDNMESGRFDVFWGLCKKYYPNLTKVDFYGDSFLSPFIKYILQIKTLFFRREYKEAKCIFEKLVYLGKDIPWNIKFNFKDFYLWYFLIKIKQWFIFKVVMDFFIVIKGK